MGKRPKIIDAEFSIVQEAKPLKPPLQTTEVVAVASAVIGAAVAFGVALAFKVLFYDGAAAWINRLIWGD